MQSFPCHVYYDEQLGVFESVNVDPFDSFYATRPSSTCTSSTIYLSESRLNQVTTTACSLIRILLSFLYLDPLGDQSSVLSRLGKHPEVAPVR